MKNMKKKRILFMFGMVALLLYACIQDELITDERRELPKELTAGKNRELTITAAKEWYVNNGSSVTRMGVTQNNVSGILITPSWNHAKEWKKGKYEVVEASLRSNMNVIFYDQDTKKQKKKMSKKDKGRVKNVARTVILKDITTGEIITFNMVFIGSLDYLMKHDDLSDNNYLHRVPHFDGMVLYFCPSGEFVNGWKYKNGKIIKRLSPVLDEAAALSDTLSSTTTRSNQDCYTDSYMYSYYYCPPITRSAFMDDWATFYGTGEFGGGMDNSEGGGGDGSGGSNGSGDDNGPGDGKGDGILNGGELEGPTVTAPSCYWINVEVPIENCNDNGNSDGGYIGGGGGGGTPQKPDESNKETYEDVDPCAAAQKLSLDEDFKNRCNALLQEIIAPKNGVEDGWSKTTTGEVIRPAHRKEGSVKYDTNQLENKKLVELYHTHPLGAPYPSFADLKGLARNYLKGRIDVANFSYGVISAMGCFTIVISSEDSFRLFAENISNLQKDETTLEWENMRSTKAPSIDGTIAKYIDFLKAEVSGLEIMFSPTKYNSDDSVYLGDWKAKSSNGKAKISDTNCNN